jgi:hypothetical protein
MLIVGYLLRYQQQDFFLGFLFIGTSFSTITFDAVSSSLKRRELESFRLCPDPVLSELVLFSPEEG